MAKVAIKREESPEKRGALRRRMKDLLMLLPNLLKLLVRLVRDPRVSRADKVILGERFSTSSRRSISYPI